MRFGPKIKQSVIVAASAGALLTAAPAQAGGLQRGLFAGLIGGVALGALASAAQSQQIGVSPFLARVPVYTATPEFIEEPELEILPERRPRPSKRERVRVAPQRPAPAAQASSDALAKCSDVLTAQAQRLGAVDVNVSSAGSELRARNGSLVLPIDARIEYARRGKRNVRQAQVTCRISPDGQVIGLR
jgi:hypothetical protein